MPEFETVFVVTIYAFVGIAAALIVVYMTRAYLDGRRWDREAMVLVRRGLCPCCGGPMPAAPETNCPNCDNWVKGYREAAESGG